MIATFRKAARIVKHRSVVEACSLVHVSTLCICTSVKAVKKSRVRTVVPARQKIDLLYEKKIK